MITEIHVTGDELNALNKKVGGIHMPKQITEQEYIQTCNTEQLAKVLNTIFLAKTFCQVCSDDCGIGQECKYDCCGKQDDFITWLKQPHIDKE